MKFCNHILVFLLCLFAATNAFSQAYKLNERLASGGDVFEAEITPDGKSVIYRADMLNDGTPELFRVPIEGGPSTKLNIEITAFRSGGVDFFRISPDSQYVVYAGNITQSSYMDLYSVRLSDGATKRLNCDTQPLAGLFRTGPSIIQQASITPDSRHVVYLHDHVNFQQNRLYSAPIDQEAPATLNGSNQLLCGIQGTLELSPQPNSTAPSISYSISPTSDRVVLRYANVNVNQSPANAVSNLYSSPIDSRSLNQINTAAQAGASQRFEISPDGRFVIFSAETNQNGEFRLFQRDIDAQAAAKVLLNVPNSNQFGVFRVDFSADGTRVIFTALDSSSNTRYQVFSAPLEGNGAATNLYPTTLFNTGISTRPEIATAPSANRMVYTKDHDTVGVFELFRLDDLANTTNPTKVVGLAPNRIIRSLQFTPDSRRILYIADKDTDNVFELFSVPITGGESVKLNPEIGPGQRILSYKLSEDGQYVAYELDDDTNLFASPVIGGEPIKVNGNLVAGGEIESFQISANGRHVIYRADQIINGVIELFAFELPVIEDESFCVPVKSINQKVAIICL